MARQITIPEKTILVQPEIKHTGTEITEIRIILDDGGCVIASWRFGYKSFSQTLWDASTTPTYEEIGLWSDEDVNSRIEELTV